MDRSARRATLSYTPAPFAMTPSCKAGSFSLLLLLVTAAPVVAGEAWLADRGDGTYRNPVIHADYSDPDAIRVGDDFWLTSSSFSHVPGLPILHSRDLVNWELVAHALPRLVPEEAFATPQPGKGVWAPALRHHGGKFWIYYPDPDSGLYVLTATDPRGPWSSPVLVRAGKGLIDPCPLWDDDGRVYLIHGWARSRAGFANVLTLLELDATGTRVIADFGVVINGDRLPHYTTLEGPKLYKRDGWYYVFAPAGGVQSGWQSVFRARSIRGPYDDRIVLAQGSTPINGPHQGALVDTPSGESWFLHFQDKDAYGRVVHLEPVAWRDGWPVIGEDPDGDGRGQPVLVHRKPAVAAPSSQPLAPATSDDFDAPSLGLPWQWQANPRADWYSLTARRGFLRLFAQPAPDNNLYRAPHLLLQKFPAPAFVATARLEFPPHAAPSSAGLVVFGYDYATIGLQDGKIACTIVRHAHQSPVRTVATAPLPATTALHLRVTIADGAVCRFAFSGDGTAFTDLGEPFQATAGRWVGAKLGLFAAGSPDTFVDCDRFRVAPASPASASR